ncbi:hypothetical protein HAQ00_08240 [Acidithiobacillus caldus ATCC 51756]|uniref:NHL repeat n=2 Tax=Acidithiobacillus caldus TaxID=33059 RepID=A0A059ZRE4_ACICK|nr:NHL repeat [Acidithiobacillus caldus ATCC 51756]MBU2730751.1 hypothetical protein [Acidithiobacillus caldus]MBU2735717.1 hypothetical protein [Acidithiobacillus caldus ATCC 51756]MBU2744700.1 hypothetical protein [Acidithiobacillus caldus]MBU2763971.1 hypothetical protein [Acidithiobacillus caldus]
MEQFVSLRQKHISARSGGRAASAAFLLSSGARVILGEQMQPKGVVGAVVPSRETLFGPRGAAVTADGALWVCDTGHHRLLGWNACPKVDGQGADHIIGHADFSSEGRNGHSDVGVTTLNVPTGIVGIGQGLAVADAWNHRVLIWREAPRRTQQPADLVLGQADFSGSEINRGNNHPSANTLFWPYGVHWDGERLYVADTGNRRVLWWDGLPVRNGQAADGVLGQRDFVCRDENAGGAPSAMSMRWPHAVTRLGSYLAVADAGDNRVLIWSHLPATNGQSADFVLGQRDATADAHNQGEYYPTASSFNMPYGISAFADLLVVADTANSRLLGWRVDEIAEGAPASVLAAQPDFGSKGDNRWGTPQRDSLCWPYGIQAAGSTLIVADSGNNRVLLWDRLA